MHSTFSQYSTNCTLTAELRGIHSTCPHVPRIETQEPLVFDSFLSLNSIEGGGVQDWDWSAARQWLCRLLSVFDFFFFLRSPSPEPKGHINFGALMLEAPHILVDHSAPLWRNHIWRCAWFVWNLVPGMIRIENKQTQGGEGRGGGGQMNTNV